MKNGIGTFSIFIPTYLLSKMLYVEEIVTLQLRLDLATTRALYVAGAKRGGGPVQETDSDPLSTNPVAPQHKAQCGESPMGGCHNCLHTRSETQYTRTHSVSYSLNNRN